MDEYKVNNKFEGNYMIMVLCLNGYYVFDYIFDFIDKFQFVLRVIKIKIFFFFYIYLILMKDELGVRIR